MVPKRPTNSATTALLVYLHLERHCVHSGICVDWGLVLKLEIYFLGAGHRRRGVDLVETRWRWLAKYWLMQGLHARATRDRVFYLFGMDVSTCFGWDERDKMACECWWLVMLRLELGGLQ